MAAASIEMASGPDKGKSYPIDPVAKKFTLGRTENNDIQLEGKTISRHHAQISVRNGNYVITDLGSKNRTKVNGEPITEKVLADGDEIRIGSNVMRFRGGGVARSSGEAADDDGTQFVDMGSLLARKGKPAPPKAPLDEEEVEGTEEVNMGALVKSKGGAQAKKASASQSKEEPDDDERTNIIDQAKFLGKSRSSISEPKAAEKGKAPRPSSRNTPQNVSFARTEEGGNIEEGTDLLNMEEVLGDSAPKVREISPTFLAVAGGGLVVGVLVLMVVYQAVFATSSASQVEKLVVGQNKILHLNARPDNLPTGIPVKADQDLVGVEQFLVTQNKQRGEIHYHFSLVPQFPGTTAMVLQYANGDILQIVFAIEEAEKVPVPGTRDEKIEEAKKALRGADDFWANRTSARATLRNAYLKYETALKIMGQVELGQNLDEYKTAKAGMELARSEIEGQRVELEKKFGQSERREDWAGAQQLLEEMLELRLGDNDLIYLKNKTIMEYRYGRTVPD